MNSVFSSYFKMCIFIITLAVMVGVKTNAISAEIKWERKVYSHYSEQEDIKDLLTDFFAFQRIGVVFSEEVKGKVSGNFKDEVPKTFFMNITNAYNLIWYYDGAAVYVYSAHEMTSNVMNLRYLNMKQLKQNLSDLDILDPKFAFRIVAKDRIVYVSGPKRYVDLISNLAEQLDEKAWAMRGENDIVKVFKLKYAWAEDKTIIFRDKDITIPGVATILRDLITGNTAPNEVQTELPKQLSSNLKKLKGKGLGRQKYEHEKKESQNKKEVGKTEKRVNNDKQGYPTVYDEKNDIGVVEADIRQNAVAVRDRKEKMPYYKKIIDLLDVPVGLVEIKATIIDIDRGSIEDLGVGWEFKATDSGNEYKGGMNTKNQFSTEEGLQLPIGNGLNLATIIGDAKDYFLGKVHALEEKDHAKILSTPSVLTLNNLEAQLEHSKTFYVRLAGEREVDLFDINAGVVLKVTPHIIKEKNVTLIKLAIQIEDGELLFNEQVDDIPIVKKSVVNTQAVVGQNESLLLGGYLKESNRNITQKVPCLGNIPGFGWLFKTKYSEGGDVERLFLITPKIKTYPSDEKMVRLKNTND